MPDGTLKTPNNPPAGWYDDPDGTQRQRWFDGSNWADYYQSPEAAAPVYIVRPPSANHLALASLIIGAISLPFMFQADSILFCLPPAIALVFGIIGLNTAKHNRGLRRKEAIFGVVLSGSALIYFVASVALALNRL